MDDPYDGYTGYEEDDTQALGEPGPDYVAYLTSRTGNRDPSRPWIPPEMWQRIPQDIRDHLIGKNRPEPGSTAKARVGFQPGPGPKRQAKAHVLNPDPAPDPGELSLWNVQITDDDLDNTPEPDPEHFKEK